MTYSLAGIHFVLTLITNFELGVVKLLPFRLHGTIELIVSITLVGSPWILGFSENYIDRFYYVAFGAAVFIVWTLTDYKGKSVA
jgi:hypothetical protein